MKGIRGVVFDLDDTLYLERDYVRSGFDAVGRWALANLGIRELSARAWALFDAGIRGSTFDDALKAEGVEPTPELVARLVEVYRNHRPDIRALTDADSCIGELVGRVDLAVVSDGPVASQQAKADALGVQGWSKVVVLTAALGDGYGKPDPRSFELVERELGVDGPDCAYLADNPAKDFGGPRSRGWTTVRVRRAGSLHHAVESGPDVDLETVDLSAIASMLLR